MEITIMTEDTERYIPLEVVAERLGVVRGTVYHYLHQLRIKTKKFPMDRRTYLSRADYDKLMAAKKAATEGRHE